MLCAWACGWERVFQLGPREAGSLALHARGGAAAEAGRAGARPAWATALCRRPHATHRGRAERGGGTLSPDVGARDLADGEPELGHRAVELGAAVEPHVGVRQGPAAGQRQRLAAGADERAAAQVLVRQGLAEAVGGRGDGAAQQQGELGEEGLAERAALVLSLLRIFMVVVVGWSLFV